MMLTSVRRYGSSSGAAPRVTALLDWHKERGGKIVEFAGWNLPVQYALGVKGEHQKTREEAGLFDVSHMGQVRITGRDRVRFMESLVVGDLAELAEGGARLSLFTTPKGGIMDDTVITRNASHLYVVVNAGNRDKDLAHMHASAKTFKGDVRVEENLTHSLLALQGPKAVAILRKLLAPDVAAAVETMPFMSGRECAVDGIADCRVTRCGYTGEDGYEISVPNARAAALATRLVDGGASPVGLGARDSLRLEAGLCRWGNDIDESTNPVEASLVWVIGKRRRTEGGFPGADVILPLLGKTGGEKVPLRRVGLKVESGVVRPPSNVADAAGKTVGRITSGSFGPTIDAAIAMAYVPRELAAEGTRLKATMRSKLVDVVVTKMPFVPARYYKP